LNYLSSLKNYALKTDEITKEELIFFSKYIGDFSFVNTKLRPLIIDSGFSYLHAAFLTGRDEIIQFFLDIGEHDCGSTVEVITKDSELYNCKGFERGHLKYKYIDHNVINMGGSCLDCLDFFFLSRSTNDDIIYNYLMKCENNPFSPHNFKEYLGIGSIYANYIYDLRKLENYELGDLEEYLRENRCDDRSVKKELDLFTHFHEIRKSNLEFIISVGLWNNWFLFNKIPKVDLNDEELKCLRNIPDDIPFIKFYLDKFYSSESV
jgi:hypothetical protein